MNTTNLTNATLTNATLTHATLEGCTLIKCDIKDSATHQSSAHHCTITYTDGPEFEKLRAVILKRNDSIAELEQELHEAKKEVTALNATNADLCREQWKAVNELEQAKDVSATLNQANKAWSAAFKRVEDQRNTDLTTIEALYGGATAKDARIAELEQEVEEANKVKKAALNDRDTYRERAHKAELDEAIRCTALQDKLDLSAQVYGTLADRLTDLQRRHGVLAVIAADIVDSIDMNHEAAEINSIYRTRLSRAIRAYEAWQQGSK